jgi:uncharacterized protein YegL
MPRFTDNMPSINIPNNFQYSATAPDKLEGTSYTLVHLVVDVSGSVGAYANELEQCVKQVIEGCEKSPYRDRLLIRTVMFNRNVTEFHGFRPLEKCELNDYSGSIRTGGATSLYDAVYSATESTKSYAKSLYQNDLDVNAIIVIITDGADVSSKMTQTEVSNSIKSVLQNEELESLRMILIGVNTAIQGCADYLDSFCKEAGIDQFEKIEKVTGNGFAKMADFVSKSISAQSQAIGTGAPSVSLSF